MGKKAVELHSKSPVHRYFDDSAHALKKGSGAFCARTTKSVVWKPTLMLHKESDKYIYIMNDSSKRMSRMCKSPRDRKENVIKREITMVLKSIKISMTYGYSHSHATYLIET